MIYENIQSYTIIFPDADETGVIEIILHGTCDDSYTIDSFEIEALTNVGDEQSVIEVVCTHLDDMKGSEFNLDTMRSDIIARLEAALGLVCV